MGESEKAGRERERGREQEKEREKGKEQMKERERDGGMRKGDK